MSLYGFFSVPDVEQTTKIPEILTGQATPKLYRPITLNQPSILLMVLISGDLAVGKFSPCFC